MYRPSAIYLILSKCDRVKIKQQSSAFEVISEVLDNLSSNLDLHPFPVMNRPHFRLRFGFWYMGFNFLLNVDTSYSFTATKSASNKFTLVKYHELILVESFHLVFIHFLQICIQWRTKWRNWRLDIYFVYLLSNR